MRFIKTLSIVAVALSMQSCLTTLLTLDTRTSPTVVTTAPVTQTTVVVSPTVAPVNVIVPNVRHMDYLDLHAVAAAFAQASSVQQFEQILNSRAYMINNVDLNGDGYIDYLRVRETMSGYHHKILVQAVLDANWVETVATIEVMCNRTGVDYIKVIGAPTIYGQNYVYQPTFCNRPPMFVHMHSSSYKVWYSPYGWNSYPSYYSRPVPVSKAHYDKYVHTYITHNRYVTPQTPSRPDTETKPQTQTQTQSTRNLNDSRTPVNTPSNRTQTTTTTRAPQQSSATTTTTTRAPQQSSTTTTTTTRAPQQSSTTTTATTRAPQQSSTTTTTTTRAPQQSSTTTTTTTRAPQQTTTTRMNSATGRVSSHTETTSVPNSDGSTTRTTTTTRVNSSGNTTTRTTTTTSSPQSSSSTSSRQSSSSSTRTATTSTTQGGRR